MDTSKIPYCTATETNVSFAEAITLIKGLVPPGFDWQLAITCEGIFIAHISSDNVAHQFCIESNTLRGVFEILQSEDWEMHREVAIRRGVAELINEVSSKSFQDSIES